MTDTPSAPTRTADKQLDPAVLLVIIPAIAWLLAVVMTYNKYSTFTDQRDSFTISAPQVTQIANEFFVEIAPWFMVAVAVTAICGMIALVTRRT